MTTEASNADAPYKVVCVSLYSEDLARLDAIVKALRARGVRGVSRSSVIREAVDRLDAASVGRVLR